MAAPARTQPASGRSVGAARSYDRGRPPAAPPIGAFRLAAVVLGVLLAAPDLTVHSYAVMTWATVLAAYGIYRTFRPATTSGPEGLRTAVVDVALSVAAVVSTGSWDSPFVLSLLTAVIIVGFGRGFTASLLTAAVSAAVVSAWHLTHTDDLGDTVRNCAQWAVLLAGVAIVAGYARRISNEQARQHSLTLDRLGRLAEANALLFSLHRLAQKLPESLDLDEVLDSTMSRLKDVMSFTCATIFLYDDTDDSWVPARREGNRRQQPVHTGALPPPLQRAMHTNATVHEPDLDRVGGPGLTDGAGAGLYAGLRARGALIGLVAVEAASVAAFTRRDVDFLGGLLEPLALAIDNARWFARLRTIGAEEERTRIARELHDRIGQSLAYLGFELDRTMRAAERGADVRSSIDALRNEVRSVTREVRDTLYDLRTDVSEQSDVQATMETFLARVRERSSLVIEFEATAMKRLPLPQERELWRIAKEAVINAERHAEAKHLWVRWSYDGEVAVLVVADDGVGFVRGSAGRLDSYGILGMRERAASIGARFEIESQPQRGTTVRVTLSSA